MIEGGDQIEGGDALGLDQGERGGGVEAGEADEGAPHQRHGEQRAHPHGVIERHHAERAFPRPVEVLRDMGERGGPFGPMAAGHPFGLAGGARGIEEEGKILRGRAARRCVGAGKEEFVKADLISLRLGADHDAPPPRRRRAPPYRLRRGRLEDEGLGFGILQHEIDVGGARPPIDRGDDETGELAGPMEERRLQPVLQHGDEACPLRQAEVVEPPHQGGDAGEALAVGEARHAIEEGEGVRGAGGAYRETGAKIEHQTSPFPGVSLPASSPPSRAVW